MQVETRAIKSVIPYERNPRKIGDEAISAVRRSIEEFGWRQPIVVDSEGIIIVGHARYYAASAMKLKEVPVHVWDDCSDGQAMAYRLADNKTSEIAEWDVGKLGVELRDLVDFDMKDFGFSEMELEMAKIDDLGVMTGEEEEPWGGDPNAYVSNHEQPPRCIVYFHDEDSKGRFLTWLETQPHGLRKAASTNNETYVVHMPPQEKVPYKVEGEED